MDRNQIRSIVQGQFQTSIAQSGVEITAIPEDQLNAITTALADSLFSIFDAIEDESVVPMASNVPAASHSTPREEDEPERVLWTGRPYLSIGIRYELTTERLRIMRGVLSHNLDEVELVRIRDTKVKQHLGERAVNIGDITIVSNDPSTPEIVLNNVKDPKSVRELIREAVMVEKEKRGLHYREEM
ncbi:MAG: PH domain-containing protein [Chloroflexota bacterium]